jgi:hypothetical protein
MAGGPGNPYTGNNNQGGPDVGTGDNSEQDPGGELDVIDPSGDQTDFIKHGWNRLLLKLLLSIFPRQDIKSELDDHGLKAEPGTPEEVLKSPEMQKLAVRPKQLPFAQDSVGAGYQDPRRSLRVSR